MPLPDEIDDLDEEFPLGDGAADTDAVVYCPYCNESVAISLDPGSGPAQQYVEDCEVCCQPIQVTLPVPCGRPLRLRRREEAALDVVTDRPDRNSRPGTELV